MRPDSKTSESADSIIQLRIKAGSQSLISITSNEIFKVWFFLKLWFQVYQGLFIDIQWSIKLPKVIYFHGTQSRTYILIRSDMKTTTKPPSKPGSPFQVCTLTCSTWTASRSLTQQDRWANTQYSLTADAYTRHSSSREHRMRAVPEAPLE